MAFIRSLTVAASVAAALAGPQVAGASAARSHRCPKGSTTKVVHKHHHRHVICVYHAIVPQRPVTQPPATPDPSTNDTTDPTPPTTTDPSTTTVGTTTTPDPSTGDPAGQAPPSGPPPVDPTLGGLPGDPGRAAARTPAPQRRTAGSVTGQAYGAAVSCNGSLSISDVIPATGTTHQAGFIDIMPSATPGSAFSTQTVAARVLMYSWSTKKWQWITNWNYQNVSQPNSDVITIGDQGAVNYSPFRSNGNLGAQGWVYIATDYYWWTGAQWAGGNVAYTTSYLQDVAGAGTRTTGNGWCYLG